MTEAVLKQPVAAPAARSGREVKTLPLISPAVVLLLFWSILPLLATLYFSFEHYDLLSPPARLNGGLNYTYLFTDMTLWVSIENSVILVVAVLAASVVLGTGLALLLNNEFPGRNVARLLAIAPFFVMSPVAALVWKNLLLDPVNGLIGWMLTSLGFRPISWFTTAPMSAVIIIYAWRWIPFATLILLTALQSLDTEQIEAARMDGAKAFARLRYIVLPHLARPITIVIMVESIFLLSAFAVIYATTNGGPGLATTTLTYLVYIRALVDFSIGSASAAGIFAIILANIIAFFLVRAIARNLHS
jgi:sorbitol/mannitol transport system permease protein